MPKQLIKTHKMIVRIMPKQLNKTHKMSYFTGRKHSGLILGTRAQTSKNSRMSKGLFLDNLADRNIRISTKSQGIPTATTTQIVK